MHSQDRKTTYRSHGRPTITAVKVVLVFVALVLLTHVSWNLFAPDLFGLPEIRMKQALGLVTFAAIINLLLRHSFDGQSHG